MIASITRVHKGPINSQVTFQLFATFFCFEGENLLSCHPTLEPFPVVPLRLLIQYTHSYSLYLDLQKTHHVTATNCCVTSQLTRKCVYRVVA
jgi:hypothetical protein